MPRYAAFIRAIMLGRGGVERTALLDAFIAAGAQATRSHLATGNVTFEAEAGAVQSITAHVEAALVEMSQTQKRVFVRSQEHLTALARAAPFESWPDAHLANELCVIFLDGPIELPFELPTVSDRGDTTYLARTEREVFIATHLVNGRPGSPGAWLERRLKAPVTIRNWNTVARVLRSWDT